MENERERLAHAKENPISVYGDFLGNQLTAAVSFINQFLNYPTENNMKNARRTTTEFFRRVAVYQNSGYTPTDRINAESLDKIRSFEFRDLLHRPALKELKEYFESLKPDHLKQKANL